MSAIEAAHVMNNIHSGVIPNSEQHHLQSFL